MKLTRYRKNIIQNSVRNLAIILSSIFILSILFVLSVDRPPIKRKVVEEITKYSIN